MEDESLSYSVYSPFLNPIGEVERPFPLQVFGSIQYIVAIFSIGTVSLFGMVFNVLTILIFRRLGVLSHNCHALLTALAVAGFFFSLHNFVGLITLFFFYRKFFLSLKWLPGDFYAAISERPGLMFSDITSCLMAFVSIERLVCISIPLRAKKTFTVRVSCIAILCVFSAMLALHMPHFLEKTPQYAIQRHFPPTLSDIKLFQYLPSGLVPHQVVIYLINYFRSTLRALTYCIVFVGNVSMFRKVKLWQQTRNVSSQSGTGSASGSGLKSTSENRDNTSGRNRTQLNSETSDSKEMKLARMIAIANGMFSACNVVDLVEVAVLRLSGMEMHRDYHYFIYYTVHNVSVLLQNTNAACSFIIYYLSNSSFRDTFQKCFTFRHN